LKQILPGFHYITGLPAGRVYVIEDSDGLTLIDASVPGQTDRILAQVKELGKEPKDVKRLLLTHAHPDHVGSLPELKAATGAQLITHALERPVVEGKMPIPRVEPKTPGAFTLRPPNTILKPTPVDRELQGGETLDIMGGLEAVFTPGHAPGHLAFWQPQKRILIAGDVIFNLFGLGLPLAFLTVDMAEDKRSIRKLVDLKPALICFGHGNPITENTPARLEAFAQKVGA
jgi:glyoxylase-like metal-dependent hydrolase (beta-lactamase superfamily II)